MNFTLQEFWDKLNAHDWYYHMSDDHRAYKRGADMNRFLLDQAKGLGGEYLEMFNGFQGHYSVADHSDPKPKRPVE